MRSSSKAAASAAFKYPVTWESSKFSAEVMVGIDREAVVEGEVAPFLAHSTIKGLDSGTNVKDRRAVGSSSPLRERIREKCFE